jgi:hypothetical protein
MKSYLSVRNNLPAIGYCLLTIGLFSSCSKNNDKNPTPNIAGFMAFNLAPDKPLIGIALSGNHLNAPLPYTSYTGGYIGIYPGTRPVEAYDASSGNTFASATYSFEPNKYYSCFITGMNGTYDNIIVNDHLDTLAGTAGSAYIRYINAIPDSSKPTVTINDGQNEVVNDNPGFATVSAFTPVKTGSVSIDIDNGSTIKADRTITLEDRKTYTLLFIGNPTGSGANDSIQIRYIENGTLKQDSTAQGLTKDSN